MEGLRLQYNVETVTTPGFSEGERVVGSTSGAVGELNSVQTSIATLWYSVITKGPNGTGFVENEPITGQTSNTQAYLTNNSDANTGQAGFTLVVNGLENGVEEGGSVEFVTGSGDGGSQLVLLTQSLVRILSLMLSRILPIKHRMVEVQSTLTEHN